MTKCDTLDCNNPVAVVTEKNGRQCKECFQAVILRAKYGILDG